MSFLLDTNVVSELRKGQRANPNVRTWFEAAPEEEIYLSVLVVGELHRGIELIRGRDIRQAAALERWLAGIVHLHQERIVAIDRSIAEQWGRLCAQRPASVVDVLSAATAQVHGMTLVTRNVKHVAWTGVRWLDPFRNLAGP